MLKFLQLLSLMTFANKVYDAIAAFETPPLNKTARRYAIVSLCCLLLGAALVLTAAIVDVIADARNLSDMFGLAGIVCFIVCVHCGLRYKETNHCQNPSRTS